MDSTKFYTKKNVLKHEYTMHKYVYGLNIVNTPKIISYDENTQVMVMERINNMCISDMYGEDLKLVDESVIKKIRQIIKKLYDNKISYPDITGYNFIEYDNKIWIIDFEHATIIHPFINSFIKGEGQWNPDFK